MSSRRIGEDVSLWSGGRLKGLECCVDKRDFLLYQLVENGVRVKESAVSKLEEKKSREPIEGEI